MFRNSAAPIIVFLLLAIPKVNFCLPVAEASGTLKTVVIDAGHGGSDDGCLGSNSKEKYIAYDIATRLGDMIKSQMPGVKVIYTRQNEDEFVPVYERIAITNKSNADLFISIHTNQDIDKTIFGTETHILGPEKVTDNFEMAMRENKVITTENKVRENYGDFNPDSKDAIANISQQTDSFIYQSSLLFATEVEDQFSNFAKRTSRGVKQSGLLILNKVTMPAVVIQVGYISNLEEEKELKGSANKEIITTSIYRALKKYKDTLEDQKKLAEVRRKQAEEARKKQEEEKRKQQEEAAAKAKVADSIAAAQKLIDDQAAAAAEVEEVKTKLEAVAVKKPAPKVSGTLTTPCYIIGCAAMPTESAAKTYVQNLQSQGFEAGYFWIPDYLPGGKNLYRVYVGPYISQGDANTGLKDVKRVSKDAYISFIQ